ncbi:UNVERIFIED_CONTAM: putative membrane protein YdjX (TVP38/TMEM64 family) [Acetivibrio alkalicellulosi]
MNNKISTIKIVAGVVFLCSIIFVYSKISIENIKEFTDWLILIKNNPYIYVIYIVGIVITSLLFIPISWVKMGGGVIFGFWPGVIIVWLATNVATNICFLIYRILGRELITGVLNRVYKNKDVMKYNIPEKIDKHGMLIVGNMRMIPILPFSITNIVCAVSNISLRDYAIGSLWGSLPGTIVSVYFSSKAIKIRDNPYGLIIPTVLIIIFNIGTHLYTRRKQTFEREKEALKPVK